MMMSTRQLADSRRLTCVIAYSAALTRGACTAARVVQSRGLLTVHGQRCLYVALFTLWRTARNDASPSHRQPDCDESGTRASFILFFGAARNADAADKSAFVTQRKTSAEAHH